MSPLFVIVSLHFSLSGKGTDSIIRCKSSLMLESLLGIVA